MHPHAIRIALKTRAAVKGGLLPERNRQTTDALLDVVRFAERFAWRQAVGKASRAKQPLDEIELFLIGARARYRLQWQSGLVRVKKLGDDEHRSAVRLVTMRQTIVALGRGDLSLKQALRCGALEMETR